MEYFLQYSDSSSDTEVENTLNEENYKQINESFISNFKNFNFNTEYIYKENHTKSQKIQDLMCPLNLSKFENPFEFKNYLEALKYSLIEMHLQNLPYLSTILYLKLKMDSLESLEAQKRRNELFSKWEGIKESIASSQPASKLLSKIEKDFSEIRKNRKILSDPTLNENEGSKDYFNGSNLSSFSENIPNSIDLCKYPIYINNNGLITNIPLYLEKLGTTTVWTDVECEMYKKLYIKYPKDFSKIQRKLKTKSRSEVLTYYYRNKYELSYFKVCAKKKSAYSAERFSLSSSSTSSDLKSPTKNDIPQPKNTQHYVDCNLKSQSTQRDGIRQEKSSSNINKDDPIPCGCSLNISEDVLKEDNSDIDFIKLPPLSPVLPKLESLNIVRHNNDPSCCPTDDQNNSLHTFQGYSLKELEIARILLGLNSKRKGK